MKFTKEELTAMFVRLGTMLEGFGTDASSRHVLEDAQRENPWFSEKDILRAVGAIRERMLEPETLRKWLDRYPALPVAAPRRVAVIAAGNIPLVGFFDLLCVLVSGHICLLKSSTKDRALMHYMMESLGRICPELPLYEYREGDPADAVIATGSDNANRYFRSRFAGLPSILRGSRASVAVLSGRETDREFRGLADDIFTYNGLGCRSVSRLLLPEGYDPGTLLSVFGEYPVPGPHYLNNYRQRKALLNMQEAHFLDGGFFLLRESGELPSAISEITYGFCPTPDDALQWLQENERSLQCAVGAPEGFPRRAPFGGAQSPALDDYPDGVDVPAFLAGI